MANNDHVTKADLKTELNSLEVRLTAEMNSLEDRLTELMRGVETKLLNAFYAYAGTNQKHLA